MRRSSSLLSPHYPSLSPSYPQIAPSTAVVVAPRAPWLAESGAPTPKKIARPEDTPADPLSHGLSRLEAILFIAREPLNTRKLAQLAGLEDGTEARSLVKRLNAHYDDVGRAFRIEEVAGGFQLFTRRKFGPWLQRLNHIPGETRLSAPGLETLAVIAYRQPVLRADIEAIRGVNCGEIIRQLMERDLVRIGGRSEELGRPYLYSTTRRFLNLFGLASLDELPRADELREISLEGFANEGAPAGLGMVPMDDSALSEESSSEEAEEEESPEDTGEEDSPTLSLGAFWGEPDPLESSLPDPSGE